MVVGSWQRMGVIEGWAWMVWWMKVDAALVVSWLQGCGNIKFLGNARACLKAREERILCAMEVLFQS